MNIFIGLIIPFVGTVLGAAMVYFLKDKLNRKFEIILLGFAAGVMMAASIWSLIIPAMEMSSMGWLIASIGIVVGVMFFYGIDYFMNKIKLNDNVKFDKMMMAITIHNIPEGMAVGVMFASLLDKGSSIGLATCLALSVGIAIQNFPEGAIVSLPLRKKGLSKNKSFWYGVVSGLFELGGAVITLLFTSLVSSILPFLLAFAAGAMIYVIIVELIPESTDNSKTNLVGFMIGFVMMMILDVVLG